MSEALRHVGLEKYEQWQAWRVLAAVLHLGDVGFGGDDVAEVDGATLTPNPSPHPNPHPNPKPNPKQVHGALTHLPNRKPEPEPEPSPGR